MHGRNTTIYFPQIRTSQPIVPTRKREDGKRFWKIISQPIVAIWLIAVIVFSLIQTIQLMEVFDIRKELKELSNSKLSGSNAADLPTGVQFNITLRSIAGDLRERQRLTTLIMQELDPKVKNACDKYRLAGENSNSNEYGDCNFASYLMKHNQALLDDVNGRIAANPYKKIIDYVKGIQASDSAPPLWYLGMTNMRLTLLVSIFMGALGGAIRMTIELLKARNSVDIRWYFFQPFLGALLALAVFIMFKAGHIALSGGASMEDGSGELNPYVIALVGILSGMLSENAYRRLGVEGARLFAGDPQRYVRPDVARAQLATLSRTPDELKRFYSDEADVGGWLDGRTKLAPEDQRIVAAWLNVPAWKLFTDQQPDVEAEGSVEEPAVPDSSSVGQTTPTERSAPPGPASQLSSVDHDPSALGAKVDGQIEAAKGIAAFLPEADGIDLHNAAEELKSVKNAPTVRQQDALARKSPPVLIATRFIKEAEETFGVLAAGFPPAALGLKLAELAARLTEAQYNRWYARVMDEEYTPATYPPDGIDAASSRTLLEQSPLWIGKIESYDGALQTRIVRGALAADRGEGLWNQIEDVRKAFEGSREAFDAATDELRKQAVRAGGEAALREASSLDESTANAMTTIDKIRDQSGPIAEKAQAAIDLLMTSFKWYKENSKDVLDITDQFRKLVATEQGGTK